MKKNKQKSLNLFSTKEMKTINKVNGGARFNSPTTLQNIDEVMDFNWILFDLGVGN